MKKEITFLSPILIYEYPDDTEKITYKTEPNRVLTLYDPAEWAAPVSEVVNRQRSVLMDYLSEKPKDDKYAELRNRLNS